MTTDRFDDLNWLVHARNEAFHELRRFVAGTIAGTLDAAGSNDDPGESA